METKQKVLQVMKEAGEPLNAGKIAELSGIDRKEVDKAMKQLKDEGAIISPVRCKWTPRPVMQPQYHTKSGKSLDLTAFVVLFNCLYLPMQNFEKILCRMSSEEISPVIVPMWCITCRISSLSRSADVSRLIAESVACRDSEACVSAW